MNYADTILHGGSYFAGLGLAEDSDYLAIKGSRILSVGKGDGWKSYCGPATREIALPQNALVVPGFHDSHLHLIMSALNRAYVDLIQARSEAEAAKMVYDFSKTIPDDPWVIGLNWYHMNWPGRRLPSKESLDRYFPDRPVFLTNTEVHGAWVNSRALELVGITDQTPDPAHGEIMRDSQGHATGYLNEMAMGLVGRYALKFDRKKEISLVSDILRDFSSKGITSVQDMRPELGYDLGQYETFYQMASEDQLNVRIHSAANLLDDIEEVIAAGEKYNSDTFQICLLKQYMDGVPTTHTAMITEPYQDRPDYCGEPVSDPQLLREQIEIAHQHGMSVKIHCCGDRAVSTILDFYEDAIRKYGRTRSRHAIEHIEILQPEDVNRFENLGIIASMQPEHMVIQVDNYEDNPYFEKYSDKQLSTSWNFRALLDRNITLSFGSDCPVVDVNPLTGIYRAVTRKFNNGKPENGMQPEQKISMREAIHCYTRNPALGVRREHELGTLEAGKYADIAVLDTNLLLCDPEEIRNAQVLLTMMNGKITHNQL